jgi:hypothetical protein
MATLSSIITPTNILTESSTDTLTNKTISGSNNTLSNVSLTTAVTGTLPVANGGTGAATLTANNVLLGNGTSALQAVAPGSSGNILTSNGTTWASTAPAGGGAEVGSLQYFSGTTAPDSSYLYCSGSIFAKSTYTALSTAIGNIPNSFAAATSGDLSTSGANTTLSSPTVSNGSSFYVYYLTESCGSYQNLAATSTNGTTWTSSGVTSPGRGPQDLIYSSANSIFVAVLSAIGYPSSTNELRTSTNFDTWTTRTTTTTILRTVRYLNNLYVTAGNGGFLATSTDAVTWTSRTSGTSSIIYGLAYGNGVYVYAGDGGVVATSTDAITWTARTSNTTSEISNLVYGTSFVATGSSYNGTSTDGITWTTQGSFSGSSVANQLQYFGGLYWMVSSGNRAVYSATGASWETYTTQSVMRTGTSTNRIIYSTFGNFNVISQIQWRTYNPFTYNTTTQFAIPQQVPASYDIDVTTGRFFQNGITRDKLTTLFIKAT